MMYKVEVWGPKNQEIYQINRLEQKLIKYIKGRKRHLCRDDKGNEGFIKGQSKKKR